MPWNGIAPCFLCIVIKIASEMSEIVKMRDVRFEPGLFVNYRSGTVLDKLLCSYQGLPKGVNYMVIGDPGVGKTTIILDLIANIGYYYKY